VRAIRLALLMTVAALALGEGFAPTWLRLLHSSVFPP
jgi:hypothetical protein